MAINKARTSPLMKAGIIALAGTFVLSIGFAGLASIPSCGAVSLLPQSDTGSTTGDNTASTETTAQIAARFSPAATAQEASLTVNPADYTVLVKQGNTYLEWANAVGQVTPSDPTAALPLWEKARGYYQRALAVKSTDAVVLGDYGITLYFSGETTAAITAAERSRAIDPKLAPNIFFLGQYYTTAGNSAKAIEAFNAYLAVDPNGPYATDAKNAIQQLSGQ